MRNLRLILFVLSFLILTGTIGFGQVKSYHFERIDASTGLKNDKISDFIQDNDGFMWMAAYNGLYRYDGIHCKYFSLQSEKQKFKFSPEITCMTKRSDGNFVIGTKNNGIYLFYPEFEKAKFCSVADKFLFSTTINTILVDKDSVFIGTDAGLYKSSLECKNFVRCLYVSQTKIYKIYKPADGSFWLGTHDFGLQWVDRKRNHCQVFLPDQISNHGINAVTAILETNDSTFFLGTWNNGLLSFNRKTKQFKKIVGYDRFNSCVVKDLAYDSVGNLWLATFAEGLGKYSITKQTFTFFKTQPENLHSISNNTILRIYKDNANILWIGTWGGYVCTFDLDAPPIQTLGQNIAPELLNITTDVSSLYQEPSGLLWIASYTNGLAEISLDKTPFHYYNVPVLSNSSVNTINRTSDGTIWAGTCNGINRISADRKKITTINLPNSVKNRPSNSISSIYVDAGDILWIGSDDGKVNQFDYKNDRFETYEGKINPGFISSFYIDKNKVIWIAGSNGLFKLDQEQKIIVNSDYYQGNNIPFAIRRILPLPDGDLVVGTENNGLLEYSRKNNSFTHIITYETLGSVYDLKFDSCAVLWLTTSNGLFSYNFALKTLNEHTHQQGIQKKEYTSLFQLSNGLMIVGGKGLNFINPYYQRKIIYQPPVVFTDLLVMDKSINPGDSLHQRVLLNRSISNTGRITLNYSENIFTLCFAALDYANPRIIEYRYKLDGFDNTWHYTNADKAFATYTNLDAGRYKLVVEAKCGTKDWNAKPAYVDIEIIPPFWRTVWFKLAIILVVLWPIYSFYRQQMALKQKEVERLRNEKLEEEIKSKEEILAVKNAELTSSAVHISHKNEILQEIRRGLRSVKYANDVNDIAQTINKINTSINQNFFTDHHWEQFEVHFNQLNHNFLERLKKSYPDLTQTNLKLCAYLRMNLSSKEIASLMNTSPNAILKSKYRLKLKFQLGKDQDLMDFIIHY